MQNENDRFLLPLSQFYLVRFLTFILAKSGRFFIQFQPFWSHFIQLIQIRASKVHFNKTKVWERNIHKNMYLIWNSLYAEFQKWTNIIQYAMILRKLKNKIISISPESITKSSNHICKRCKLNVQICCFFVVSSPKLERFLTTSYKY